MLLNETYLTFGEIADRWARETYDTRDEILLAMIRGVWRREFEDDSPEPESCLSINLPKTIRGDGVYLDEHDRRTDTPPRMAVNRRGLLAAMPPITNVPLPPFSDLCPKSGNGPTWETIKTGIPWDSLLALTLDEYDDMYRRVYLEGLLISKEDFGRWCDTWGDRRPAFWFDDKPSKARPRANQRERKNTTSKRNDSLQTAANIIWQQGWHTDQRVLKKEAVAKKLLERPDANDLCRNARASDGGRLTVDSIVRRIRVPTQFQKRR